MKKSILDKVFWLEQQIEALIEQNNSFRDVLEQKELELTESQKIIEEMKLEQKNFKKQTKLLKIVVSDDSNQLDSDKIKALLDDCIEEIDKCVDHLKKNKKS